MEQTTPIANLQGKLLTEYYKPKSSYQRNKTVIRKLMFVLFLGILLAAAKLTGGILSHSLSLISNAAHLLADLLGFVIGIVSVWYSGRPANKMHSYGFHRAGIIGAITSIVVLWVVNGFLVYFGIQRIIHLSDYKVEGKIMFIVACAGLVVNIIMILILNSTGCILGFQRSNKRGRHDEQADEMSPVRIFTQGQSALSKGLLQNQGNEIAIGSQDSGDCDEEQSHDSIGQKKYEVDRRKSSLNRHNNGGQIIHRAREVDLRSESTTSGKRMIKDKEADHQNINVRATVLHICGDLLQNLGVILVSALIWLFPDRLSIADPIATFIFAIVIFVSSIFVVKDCIGVLMESTPKGFSFMKFEDDLKALEGVSEVHDLHIWSLGVGKNAMSVHILAEGITGPVLKRVTALSRKYGIYHSTIQVEATQDPKNQHYINCKHNIH